MIVDWHRALVETSKPIFAGVQSAERRGRRGCVGAAGGHNDIDIPAACGPSVKGNAVFPLKESEQSGLHEDAPRSEWARHQ